jgi:hypothetical protein
VRGVVGINRGGGGLVGEKKEEKIGLYKELSLIALDGVSKYFFLPRFVQAPLTNTHPHKHTIETPWC